MSELRYLLAVITHGEGETLEDCLASFEECVDPAPARLAIYRDGPGRSFVPNWDMPFLCSQIAERQMGFCAATAAAWRLAVHADVEVDYVFWLEHDFVFLRPVDLSELALVLDDHRLAQVALVRGPVSPEERAAGGLIESRPGEFDEMCGTYDGRFVHPTQPWLRHRSYLTTNPNLMRTEFMRENHWPSYESECEGKFGLDLIERGYHFGAWGSGEQWVDHIGTRNGVGY